MRLGKQGGWNGEMLVVCLLAVLSLQGVSSHPNHIVLDLRSCYYPLTQNNFWAYVDRTFICTPEVRIPRPRPPRKRQTTDALLGRGL